MFVNGFEGQFNSVENEPDLLSHYLVCGLSLAYSCTCSSASSTPRQLIPFRGLTIPTHAYGVERPLIRSQPTFFGEYLRARLESTATVNVFRCSVLVHVVHGRDIMSAKINPLVSLLHTLTSLFSITVRRLKVTVTFIRKWALVLPQVGKY